MTFAGDDLKIRIHVDTGPATKGIANLKALLDKLVVQLQKESREEALRELNLVTTTWTHKPAFKGTVWHKGTEMSVTVRTSDKIFTYVDQGTRPHIIQPKGPGYPLRFSSGYQTKSRVGVLRAFKGGAFGHEIRAYLVHHPGTKARGFMTKVQEKVGKWALSRARKLVKDAVARH